MTGLLFPSKFVLNTGKKIEMKEKEVGNGLM